MIINILEKSLKNHPKWRPKSFKIGPWRCLGRVLGPSWLQVEVLSLSWRHLWGVLARSWLQDGGLGLHLGSQMEAKIHENCFQERSKRLSFLLISLCIDFGSDLVPTWLPKPSQNGAKLVPKSMQVGVLIWHLFWKGSWLHFC